MHCSGGPASNRYSQTKVINVFAEVLRFPQVDGANRSACLRTQGRATRGCPAPAIGAIRRAGTSVTSGNRHPRGGSRSSRVRHGQGG